MGGGGEVHEQLRSSRYRDAKAVGRNGGDECGCSRRAGRGDRPADHEYGSVRGRRGRGRGGGRRRSRWWRRRIPAGRGRRTRRSGCPSGGAVRPGCPRRVARSCRADGARSRSGSGDSDVAWLRIARLPRANRCRCIGRSISRARFERGADRGFTDDRRVVGHSRRYMINGSPRQRAGAGGSETPRDKDDGPTHPPILTSIRSGEGQENVKVREERLRVA